MPHPSSNNAASVQECSQTGALLVISWVKHSSRVENGELGRRVSLTHCELEILIMNCHYHVKYIMNTLQSGGHSHAPSYAPNPCKPQPQGSCHPIAFFRCSQVRIVSSIPSLHFSISSSGPGSDSAQNTEVEPM